MEHPLFFLISSPLDQFEIRNLLSLDAPILGNIHISITNIGLYLIIGSFIALTLNLLATNYNKLVSNNWSISLESIYATIHSIVINQINKKKGSQFYSDLLQTLLNISYNSIEWCLNSPPKPHAFACLPLQSSIFASIYKYNYCSHTKNFSVYHKLRLPPQIDDILDLPGETTRTPEATRSLLDTIPATPTAKDAIPSEESLDALKKSYDKINSEADFEKDMQDPEYSRKFFEQGFASAADSHLTDYSQIAVHDPFKMSAVLHSYRIREDNKFSPLIEYLNSTKPDFRLDKKKYIWFQFFRELYTNNVSRWYRCFFLQYSLPNNGFN